MKWINSLRDKSDQEEKDSKFKKQAVLEYWWFTLNEEQPVQKDCFY